VVGLGYPRANAVASFLKSLREAVHLPRRVECVPVLRAPGDPHAVQRRLGHSHISVTLGIYAYATRSDAEVAAAVDRLLGETSS